jgi:hypothetical protein
MYIIQNLCIRNSVQDVYPGRLVPLSEVKKNINHQAQSNNKNSSPS